MQDLHSPARESRATIDRLRDLVTARGTRLAIAGLIIASLLPYEVLERTLWPVFIVVFGAEIAVRVALLLAEPAQTRTREIAFFAIDVLAFLSFLPVEQWMHADPALKTFFTLLRLTRLLVLLRFSRELVLDIYSIMTRREQLQQFGLVTMAVASLAFVTAVVLHQLEISHYYDGNLDGVSRGGPDGFWDRAWWAFRQLESPDNLVSNVHVDPVIGVLSLLLTVTGVFIISFVIGLGANVVEQVVRAERRRPVSYRQHSLVAGSIEASETLVREFVKLYDKNHMLRRVSVGDVYRWLFRGGPEPRRHALPRMALLGGSAEPPGFLFEPGMRWVVYREGATADHEALQRVGADRAKRMLLLARRDAGFDTDAVTIASLAAFREVNPFAHVFVEATNSESVPLLAAAGGAGTFALDTPRFLGLFLCHHLVVPGVEALYADLLTAQGSEFYTHVFVDPEEHAALARLGDRHLAFEDLRRAAFATYGIVLAGVLLGPERLSRLPGDLIPVDRLTPWINCHQVADEPPILTELGAEPGKIPIASLQGLIAIAQNYRPLKRYARDMLVQAGRKHEPRATPVAASLVGALRGDYRPVRRVLVIGFSSALTSMLRGLAAFVPDVHATVCIGARGDERTSLLERIAALQLGLDRLPGERGTDVALGRGGRATLYTYEGRDLARFAAGCVASEPPVDAVVFMSDPDSPDPDARTQMRVLRFMRQLAAGEIPCGPRLHMLVELNAERREGGLRKLVDAYLSELKDLKRLRVTIVSTERIRSYFLVHSAFVPGVTEIYDRLLIPAGPEIVRLERNPDTKIDGVVAPGELGVALAGKGCIPLAIELESGAVRVTPSPDERYAARDVTAVYVLTDSDGVVETFATDPPPT